MYEKNAASCWFKCNSQSFVRQTVLAWTALLSYGLVTAVGQTAFLDFNTVGQYTNSFNPWNDAGGANGGNYAFMESTTAGVGGSGGVSVFQSTDTTAVYKTGSWDFSTNGASITVSTMVKANGQVSGNKVQLGILNTNSNGLNNNAGVAFESFRFIPQSSTTWSLREQFRTGGVIPPETTLGTVTTTLGDWYKFVVTLTNTAGASGTYNASCAIYDYGAGGLSPGANIVTFPVLISHTNQTDITVPAMWPGLRAFQSGGIDAWDNFLVYTPVSAPVFTVPLTNTTVAAGQTASFYALSDGPGAITYAWLTNGIIVSGATGNSYTTPPVSSGLTNIEVIATNSNGLASNSAAISVFVPTFAAITNLPAASIQTTAATLNGQVLNTGGSAPAVTLFYGPKDGGTASASWSNSISIGTQSALFSQLVAGLWPNTTYYFTAQAVNASGTSWAAPSQSFTTVPVSLASVTNFPPSSLQADSATLNGEVLDTGNDAPTITLYYGPTDGGTNAASWSQTVSLGVQNGLFAQVVSGLSSNTTYFSTAQASNAAGISWAAPSANFTTLGTNPPAAPAVAVLTHHNDNGRTGANLQESVLTVTNVNTNQFGMVFTRAVDDQIYAQPLVTTNVSIVGKGVHNLVIVATVNDSVYAFDADDPTVSAPYWQTSLLVPNSRAPRNSDMTGACGGNYQDFSGNIGIVGTPVIDPATGTIYLVARTLENGTTFVQRLHALDVTTGKDKITPQIITATYAGTGAGSVGGVLTFDPQRANQRPALTLLNGVVYIGWSSHCDWGPYHGWVIGYDAATLKQLIIFNDTPNGSNGGIWMSGQGLAADTNGNLYVSTGNGTVDTAGGANRGESFMKLSLSGTNLNIASWFTPYNWQVLESGDIDLGSGGLLLIPGTSLLFGGGKEGMVYLVNRDKMGGLSLASSDTNVVQSFPVTTDQIHGGAVWWAVNGGPYAYIWPASVHLQQYRFNTGAGNFTVPAFAQGPTAAPSGQPGGILSLSANGNKSGSGIVWASHQLTGDANQSVQPGILHAYDAQNVANELWNSQQVSTRDAVGNFAKFVPPTVANGKVYLATFSSQLNVYGLLSSTSPPRLAIAPTSLNFGTVTTGQSSNLTFLVTNSGGLNLSGTVTTAPPFKVSSGNPFSLTSGQTSLVQITFTPTNSGNFTNVVIFTSNGGNSTNVVTGSAASAVPPAQLRVTPAALNFGLVAVGSNVQSSFSVTNLGGGVLTNGSATIPGGPFSILSGTPFSLPGFGSTNLAVRFAPTNSGSFSNVVVFTSSGGNSTNAVVGTAAGIPQAAFTGAPTSGAWPLSVLFSDTSTGTITNRLWDFGDSTSSNATAVSVSHIYAGPGTNTVRLTVSGPVGTNVLTRPSYIIVTNVGPVTLTIQTAGKQVQLTWPAGTLQSAGAAAGSYTNIPAANSPYLITPSNAAQFFRIKVQ
jgi:PKD repeat protein